MASSTDLYGSLPALAAPWVARIEEYRVALTGAPQQVVRAAAGQRTAAASTVTVSASFARSSDEILRTWTGDAAHVFSESRKNFVTAADGIDDVLRAAAGHLDQVATGVADAQTGIENSARSFGNQVRAGVAAYESYLRSAPAVPAQYAVRFAQVMQARAMSALRAHIDHVGSVAVDRGKQIETQLNDSLIAHADAVRRLAPQGALAAKARTFSADFRKATQGWTFDPTLDRSFLNLLGGRAADPWDPNPRLSIPGAALGSAGLGLLSSTSFSHYVGEQPWLKAAVRAPGNFASDLLNLGGLNSDNNLIYPFEDPFLNRLSTTGASAVLGVGLDQPLRMGSLYLPGMLQRGWAGEALLNPMDARYGGYNLIVNRQVMRRIAPGAGPEYQRLVQQARQGPTPSQVNALFNGANALDGAALENLPLAQRQAILEGVSTGRLGAAGAEGARVSLKPRWAAHSTLNPATMLAAPFTVWGATAASDAMVPEPEADDPNNNQYYRHLAANSVAIGVGVGVPVGIDAKNWQAGAITTTIVTAQNGAARFLFVEPPHPRDDVFWNIGPSPEFGGRAMGGFIADKANYLDWKLHRGGSPSDGIVTNAAQTLINGTETVFRTVTAGIGSNYTGEVYVQAAPWNRATSNAREVMNDAGDLWNGARNWLAGPPADPSLGVAPVRADPPTSDWWSPPQPPETQLGNQR